jgi:hypothetical protein
MAPNYSLEPVAQSGGHGEKAPRRGAPTRIFLAQPAGSGASLRRENNETAKQPAHIDLSRCRVMNTKDYYQEARKPRPRARSRPRRRQGRPGVAAALLAVVCVAGVFGLLGLLYSLG